MANQCDFVRVSFTVAGHGTKNVIALLEEGPKNFVEAVDTGCLLISRPSFRGYHSYNLKVLGGKIQKGIKFVSEDVEQKVFEVRLYKRKETGEKYVEGRGYVRGEIEFIEAAFPNEHELTVYLMDVLKLTNHRCEKLYVDSHVKSVLASAKEKLDGDESHLSDQELYKRQVEAEKEAKAKERRDIAEAKQKAEEEEAARIEELTRWSREASENGW